MTPAFYFAFTNLITKNKREVQSVINEFMDSLLEAEDRSPDEDESTFVAVTPPFWLLHGAPRTSAELRQAITGVSDRWQFDVVEALDDTIAQRHRRRGPQAQTEPLPPQLEHFDGLAAELLDNGRVRGHILVGVGAWSTQLTGHLWWAKYSAYQWVMHVWHMTDIFDDGPPVIDHVISSDDLANELSDWRSNRFRRVGETYELRWLDRPQSSLIAERVFTAAAQPPV